MADVSRCAHCGSNFIQHGLDQAQCLDCGHHTDLTTGLASPVEPVFTGPEETV